MDGARPLVERDGRTDLEVVVEEIMQDKITFEYEDGEPDFKSVASLEEAAPSTMD
jgi:hypothetical protein